MNKPEQKLQIKIANWIRLAYPHALWTISPAGLIIGAHIGILAVRMGYRKGTSDIIILEPRGRFHGLVIELKWGDNQPSEEQRQFISDAVNRGYATAVCWTYEEAIETIDKYLNLPTWKGGIADEQNKRQGCGIRGAESCAEAPSAPDPGGASTGACEDIKPF